MARGSGPPRCFRFRVAISNTRLISHDERGVAFRYKDYRVDGGPAQDHDAGDGRVHPPFHASHPATGFHRIRHYGLFANTGRAANIARLRQLLGSAPQPEKAASLSEPAEKFRRLVPSAAGA